MDDEYFKGSRLDLESDMGFVGESKSIDVGGNTTEQQLLIDYYLKGFARLPYNQCKSAVLSVIRMVQLEE